MSIAYIQRGIKYSSTAGEPPATPAVERERMRQAGQRLVGRDRASFRECGRRLGDRPRRCRATAICPTCATLRMWAARRVIAERLTAHEREGKAALFVTLMIPGGVNRDLAQSLMHLDTALKALRQDRRWRSMRTNYGVHASVRAVEIVHSARLGWTPHVHLLLFCDTPASSVDVETTTAAVRSAWLDALINRGEASTAARAVHVQTVEPGTADTMAGYITKNCDPLYRPTGKGKSAWALLREAAETGDAPAARLWQQYAYNVRGLSLLRMLGFSEPNDGDDTGHGDGKKVENCSAMVAEPGAAGHDGEPTSTSYIRVPKRVNPLASPAGTHRVPYAPAPVKPAPVAACLGPPYRPP